MTHAGGPLILYNGASGGLGRHMAASLAMAGLRGVPLSARLEHPGALAGELARVSEVSEAVLIHLAALVSVPACEADPETAHEVNVVMAGRVADTALEWALRRGTSLRVIYVSTGHVYGPAPKGSRLNEDAPTGPRSVYATTKLAAERELGLRTAPAGVPLTVARVFGLLAPGQPAHYVLPALIDRVRQQRLVEVPGLDMVRDYLDARDVCRNLLALATAPPRGATAIVNVCSGEATTIRDLLAHVMLACGGEPSAAARVKAGAGRVDDIPWIVGDPTRFHEWTGLLPRSIPLDRTVRDAVAAMGI